jgi:hypothetical protein
VGPRARLDATEKRKSSSCRESNPGRPARSLLLYRLNYYYSILCLATVNAGLLNVGRRYQVSRDFINPLQFVFC